MAARDRKTLGYRERDEIGSDLVPDYLTSVQEVAVAAGANMAAGLLAAER
jgi:hypothetical protein